MPPRVATASIAVLAERRPVSALWKKPLSTWPGWGDVDVSSEPHREPEGYPRSRHVTVAVVEQMAHMHNFADTRAQLWEHLMRWLPVAQHQAV